MFIETHGPLSIAQTLPLPNYISFQHQTIRLILIINLIGSRVIKEMNKISPRIGLKGISED